MTSPAKPLRIKRLTLTDFRAFPGPAPEHFDFDGKNLLVYGENGAGKSSIFHALQGIFSLKPDRALRDHKNVFSGQPDTNCRVTVEFMDGKPAAEWSVSKHPGSIGSMSAEPAHYRKRAEACLSRLPCVAGYQLPARPEVHQSF